MFRFKKDGFKDRRGTWSRVLDLSCHFCNRHIAFYQKDGPGPLKRSYVDRFIDLEPKSRQLFRCPSCKEILGIYKPYKKENNRPAFNWLTGALDYKIVAISKLQKSSI